MIQAKTFPNLVGKTGLFCDGDWIESKDQDQNGDVRLIQLADVGVGNFLNKSSRFMTSAKAKELKCTYLEQGDILIARMPDPLGRACLFPGDSKPCVTVVDVCIVRVDPSVVYSHWLVHFINSANFQRQIANSITGTTRQRISRGNLAMIQIPLPTLEEQKRIAAILDKANAIRRKRQQAIALTDQLLRSVFLELFGDPVTNPKEWKTVPLDEIADIHSGITKGRKIKEQVLTEIPYMRVANVQDGYIQLDDVATIAISEEEKERYRLLKHDILLTEGGDPDKLGRGAVWQAQIDPCIHQNHIFRVRIKNSEEFTPLYLSTLIGSPYGKRYFLIAAKQTTGIATINKTQLKEFPVLIPPIHLQNKFAKVVEKIESKKQNFNDAKTMTNKLFASLIQQAFSGALSKQTEAA